MVQFLGLSAGQGLYSALKIPNSLSLQVGPWLLSLKKKKNLID